MRWLLAISLGLLLVLGGYEFGVHRGTYSPCYPVGSLVTHRFGVDDIFTGDSAAVPVTPGIWLIGVPNEQISLTPQVAIWATNIAPDGTYTVRGDYLAANEVARRWGPGAPPDTRDAARLAQAATDGRAMGRVEQCVLRNMRANAGQLPEGS